MGPVEIALIDGDAESRLVNLGEPAATLGPGVDRNPGTGAVFGYRDDIVLPLANAPVGPMLIDRETSARMAQTESAIVDQM